MMKPELALLWAEEDESEVQVTMNLPALAVTFLDVFRVIKNPVSSINYFSLAVSRVVFVRRDKRQLLYFVISKKGKIKLFCQN